MQLLLCKITVLSVKFNTFVLIKYANFVICLFLACKTPLIKHIAVAFALYFVLCICAN